jgi:hypothetical protein
MDFERFRLRRYLDWLPPQEPQRMDTPVARRRGEARMTRRVVTGHVGGKAVVLFDGPAPNRKLRQASGLVSTLLWATDESPADITGTADRAQRELGCRRRRRAARFAWSSSRPSAAACRAKGGKEMGLSGQADTRHAGCTAPAASITRC